MGLDQSFLTIIRKKWENCFFTRVGAEDLCVEIIIEDVSQIIRKFQDCRTWEDIRNKIIRRIRSLLESFPSVIQFEFLFPEHTPPSKYPLSRHRKWIQTSKPIPVIHYTERQIEENNLLKLTGDIMDIDRYLQTPMLKDSLKMVVYETIRDYQIVSLNGIPEKKFVFNGIKTSWTSKKNNNNNNNSIKNKFEHCKEIISFKSVSGEIKKNSVIIESDHIGEEDIKTIPCIVDSKEKVSVIRSSDGDLIVITLLNLHRLINSKSRNIEGKVILDLSDRWLRDTETFKESKRKKKGSKRKRDKNGNGDDKNSDKSKDKSKGKGKEIVDNGNSSNDDDDGFIITQVPFILDMVKLWRSIFIWGVRMDPKNHYPIHSFCLMALLGGCDYVRYSDHGEGLPRIGFTTIWNTYQKNTNMRDCISSSIYKIESNSVYRYKEGHQKMVDEQKIYEAVLWVYQETFAIKLLNLPRNQAWKSVYDGVIKDRKKESNKLKKSGKSGPTTNVVFSSLPPGMPLEKYEDLISVSKLYSQKIKLMEEMELRSWIRRVHWCFHYWGNADTGKHENPIYEDEHGNSVWGWKLNTSKGRNIGLSNVEHAQTILARNLLTQKCTFLK